MRKGSMIDEELIITRAKLTVHSPAGAFEISQPYADRLMDLSGKTICELSNGLWEDARIFGCIRGLLQKRFPDARIIPFTEFPIGTEQIDQESAVDLLLKKGCEAAIVGIGG